MYSNNMFRLFRKKTTNLQAPLGRWGAVIRNTKEDNSLLRENSIDFNSNWANHDHCGAESCQIINNDNNTKESEPKSTKNSKTTDNNRNNYDIYNDKEMMNQLRYIIW